MDLTLQLRRILNYIYIYIYLTFLLLFPLGFNFMRLLFVSVYCVCFYIYLYTVHYMSFFLTDAGNSELRSVHCRERSLVDPNGLLHRGTLQDASAQPSSQ